MICKKSFAAEPGAIEGACTFVCECLEKAKVPHKTAIKERLRTEEVVQKLINHAKSGSQINISVFTLFKKYEIRLASEGLEFSLSEFRNDYEALLGSDEDINGYIRSLYSKLIGENIKLRHRQGVNICSIRSVQNRRNQLIYTLSGLLLGIIAGFLIKFLLPEATAEFIASDILGSGSTLFLNAMKMIVAPLVFFSISASIADFGDLKALGKIAMKVFSFYLLTSLLAILVGFGVYALFPIGNTSLASCVSDAAASTVGKSQSMSVSIKDTVLGIIPSDIITPFLNSDMLQVIFIAILVGIAAATLGNEHKSFKDLIISGNAVFSKITAMIVSFMPLAVFCSMAKMICQIDAKALASVILWVPVCFAGDILMMCVYGLLILIAGRLNPFKFFKGFFPATLTAFSLGSSNATIPVSVKMCEKLGIDKRMYSFSIPFGATVNMDGTCVALAVSSLFMAKIFGLEVSASMLLTIAISILTLSIGAPGVPGGCLVCLAFLLPQIGVPAEAISIVMGLYSLMAMGLTACNVTGDAVVTAVVAKTEKMLDIKKYNSN